MLAETLLFQPEVDVRIDELVLACGLYHAKTLLSKAPNYPEDRQPRHCLVITGFKLNEHQKELTLLDVCSHLLCGQLKIVNSNYSASAPYASTAVQQDFIARIRDLTLCVGLV